MGLVETESLPRRRGSAAVAFLAYSRGQRGPSTLRPFLFLPNGLLFRQGLFDPLVKVSRRVSRESSVSSIAVTPPQKHTTRRRCLARTVASVEATGATRPRRLWSLQPRLFRASDVVVVVHGVGLSRSPPLSLSSAIELSKRLEKALLCASWRRSLSRILKPRRLKLPIAPPLDLALLCQRGERELAPTSPPPLPRHTLWFRRGSRCPLARWRRRPDRHVA